MPTQKSNPLPQGTIVEICSGEDLSLTTLAVIISTPIVFDCYREYIIAELEVEGTPPEWSYVLKESEKVGLPSNSFIPPDISNLHPKNILKVLGTISTNDLQGMLNWLSTILAIYSEYSPSQPSEFAPGRVIWVDYEFTDHTKYKERPMVIVSQTPITQAYDIVISLYITSQIVKATCDTDWILYDWQSAGLKELSAVRCRFQTDSVQDVISIARHLVTDDFAEVQRSLRRAFGLPED